MYHNTYHYAYQFIPSNPILTNTQIPLHLKWWWAVTLLCGRNLFMLSCVLLACCYGSCDQLLWWNTGTCMLSSSFTVNPARIAGFCDSAILIVTSAGFVAKDCRILRSCNPCCQCCWVCCQYCCVVVELQLKQTGLKGRLILWWQNVSSLAAFLRSVTEDLNFLFWRSWERQKVSQVGAALARLVRQALELNSECCWDFSKLILC